MNHVIILQLGYTFLNRVKIKFWTWLCRTRVKRSTEGMSILQYLFSRDFHCSYHKILPWRTEGLSDSSTLAMSLQTSPNWRKNWIKFRTFRSISESFHFGAVSCCYPGPWQLRKWTIFIGQENNRYSPRSHHFRKAWKAEMQSFLFTKLNL